MLETTTPKKLILIDGNAIVHRAFHALPPLTYNGKLLNAVYGFFSMFFKIVEDLKPSRVIVCFDRPAPTFRKQLYVGYQAARPKMSDDLSPQIDVIHEVLEKVGIPIYELDGYEADDLIGTLASQASYKARGPVSRFPPASARSWDDKSSSLRAVGSPSTPATPRFGDLEVIIVSGDRDLLQLVNSHVKVLAPVTGITKMVLYDEKAVEEKYGLKPTQIIDYKALIGDASDNYPGVSGIGPKTASDLLKKYETFENLYQHLAELSPKVAEKLATDAEQAALAKKLATIVCDAPVRLDLEKASWKNFSSKIAREALEKLGFKSILNRIPAGEGEEKEVYVNEMTHLEEKHQKNEIGQIKVKQKINKKDPGQLDLL